MVLRLRYDTDEVFANDYLGEAGNISNGTLVHVRNRRSHCGRPNHATVKHVRHTDSVNELELASHQDTVSSEGTGLPSTVHCATARRFAVALSGMLNCMLPTSSSYLTGVLSCQ